jgi:hypothetical protein
MIGGRGTQVLGGVRISGWGTGSLFSVILGNGLEILESLALGEDAELEFVACYVEEGVFWAEDLTKEGMIELVEPRPWDAHEGEFYWEKGDVTCMSRTKERRGRGMEVGGYKYLLRGGVGLEITRLAKDLPSFIISLLIAPN